MRRGTQIPGMTLLRMHTITTPFWRERGRTLSFAVLVTLHSATAHTQKEAQQDNPKEQARKCAQTSSSE